MCQGMDQHVSVMILSVLSLQISKQIMEVFENAEEVMTKFIQNVTEKVLLVSEAILFNTWLFLSLCNTIAQDYVNKELLGKSTEDYLQRLFQLHIK